MPRPKLPEDEKKGMVLRLRTQPWLYQAVKSQAQAHGHTLSAELSAILTSSLTSGAQEPQ